MKILCEQELDNLPTELTTVLEDKPAVFKKLEVQSPIPNAQVAVIVRLNGAIIEVSEGASQ